MSKPNAPTQRPSIGPDTADTVKTCTCDTLLADAMATLQTIDSNAAESVEWIRHRTGPQVATIEAYLKRKLSAADPQPTPAAPLETLLANIVEADGDYYTDAPECADAVEKLKDAILSARFYLRRTSADALLSLGQAADEPDEHAMVVVDQGEDSEHKLPWSGFYGHNIEGLGAVELATIWNTIREGRTYAGGGGAAHSFTVRLA